MAPIIDGLHSAPLDWSDVTLSNESELAGVSHSGLPISADKFIHRLQPCAEPFNLFYCFNAGRCYTLLERQEVMFPFCRCMPNFHGHRCEYLFDPNFYQNELKTAMEMEWRRQQQNQFLTSLGPPSTSSSSALSPSLLLLPLLLVFILLILFRQRFFR